MGAVGGHIPGREESSVPGGPKLRVSGVFWFTLDTQVPSAGHKSERVGGTSRNQGQLSKMAERHAKASERREGGIGRRDGGGSRREEQAHQERGAVLGEENKGDSIDPFANIEWRKGLVGIHEKIMELAKEAEYDTEKCGAALTRPISRPLATGPPRAVGANAKPVLS